MNQLSHGQKINIPTAVVRSVSFQKVRQGSLSSRANNNTQKTEVNQKGPRPLAEFGLCEKLMSKKLLGNDQMMQNKQNDIKNNYNVNTIENDKISLLKKQLQQKQMKQCTFRPKVNKSNCPQRSLQQFVDQQYAYKRFKDDKINQMRQIIQAKMDKQNTFQPNTQQISKTNNTRRNLGQQVHERLYQQFNKRQQNKTIQSVQKRPNSKFSTQNKITTFSRKGSQKSILQNGMQSKRHHINTIQPSEFSSLAHGSCSSKQNTLTNQNETNKIENARSNSCQSAKSQKGLKITKYMDVQQVCEKKVGQRLKQKDYRSERQRQRQKNQIKSNQNPKNKELYIKKILREINCILHELLIQETKLNYMQMSLILQKMNFLDQQTNINDRKYSYEIWQMLQGDLYENCPLANLIRIIFCLLGCYDFPIIQQCLAIFIPQSSAKKLVLTQKQARSIKTNFQQLYLNRLRKGEHITSEPKAQQYSFKPFVSKNSSQMAQKYRQRVIQESQQLLNKNLMEYQIGQKGQVGHVDLLMLDQKRKQVKMRMRRQQVQKQKKRLQDQSMLGQKSKRSKNKLDKKYQSTEQQAINQRFEHLYELGKYSIRNKNQKSTQQQKIPKQCTFHPNINKSKQNSNSNKNSQNPSILQNSECRVGQDIKDFDKSIFRMYEGRRIRQQSFNHGHGTSHQTSKIMTDRSMLSEQQRSREEDNTPFLYLNVCMEGCDDIKVPVFHCDNMRTITHKVKILMGLQNADDSRLQQILKLQIMPTLQQIGMNVQFQ